MLIRSGGLRLGAIMGLAALLAPAHASAQVVSAETSKALWCATALIAAGKGTGSSDSDLEKRGNSLLARTQMALLEQGLSDEQVKTLSEEARKASAEQLPGTGQMPQYSYEDCVYLDDEPQ